MIEIYKSVYSLRQQLLSFKEGPKMKKLTSGMDGAQSSSEHSEEEESSLSQQEASSSGKQVYASNENKHVSRFIVALNL